jgi:stress response protein SCP2
MFMAGKVQAAILKNDMLEAAKMLKSRPGDFARQLDKLLRDSDEKHIAYITAAFAEVAEKVSTPVLLQVREHFIERKGEKMPIRVFFPKGNVAKAMVIPNDLPTISVTACQQIIDTCNKALVAQFKTKEPMGKVYINPDFKNYLVPFSQRSASSANKIVVRGSKLPINPKAKAVRGFIWWTNMGTDIGHYSNGRVDLDLSAAFFDEDFKYIDHVSYTNLRSKDIMAYHSGDITDGGSVDGDGVAEFIDIDISRAANKARYVVFQVYSFTNQKFSALPNVRFGWMQRQKINSGEIFEPKTVEMSIDVNSASTKTLPVIFDCVKREFIWCDVNISLDDRYISPNNLETNMSKIQAVCYAMTHLHKPNLYTLIGLNALARGEIVQSREEADIIFSNDTSQPVIDFNEAGNVKEIPIITAYDIDYIVGQLL